MALLSPYEQNGILSLLSSTSQPPISPLWFQRQDDGDPESSSIEVLPDSKASSSRIPKSTYRGTLVHNVIHLSSPRMVGTYIQAGLSVSEYNEVKGKGKGKESGHKPLGIILPWINLQIRPLGRRPFAIEVGIVDTRGIEGTIRISSFKHEVTLHQRRAVPLLHLPLDRPKESSLTLTPWLEISINLNTLIPLFNALLLQKQKQTQDFTTGQPVKKRKVEGGRIPMGKLGNVSYIRIYANCRVRRVWFTEDGQKSLDSLGTASREEWALYAAESAP